MCARYPRNAIGASDKMRHADLDLPIRTRKNSMTKTSSALDALTQLAAKVDAAIKASPVAGLEANARQHFVSQLAKQGLVTREEYEIQTALLEKTRTKLKALDARIATLEAGHSTPSKT